MRAIVLASTALALSLPLSACDNGETAEGIYSLLGNPKQCRDPRGRFAKCQTCPDGTRIWVGAECPTPPVEPTPPPPTGDQPSPSLKGAADIASNFDINLSIKDMGEPGPSGDKLGAFRFACSAGQLSYNDPIVYPGQPGKSHLHQYYGNTTTDAYSTHASLRAAGGSTCNFTGKDIAANRSAYWIPAMLDGKGNVVKPDHITDYYKHLPKSSTYCTPGSPDFVGICVPIPNGLKMIFGYDMVTGEPPTGHAYFNCGGQKFDNLELAVQSGLCQPGTKLLAVINSPTCWDGKRLDSANHRDHVSYQTGDKQCPPTHPYVMPRFTQTVVWIIRPGDDLALWRFSSDEMHPELPHGSTFHADYFEAWDPFVKGLWQGNCIDRLLSCINGNTGGGKGLLGASVPSYTLNGRTFTSSTIPDELRLVPLASIPR